MNEGRHEAHPPRTDLAAYAQGALGVDVSEPLEAHVARCDSCATALMREAQVEVALHAVAARTSLSSRRLAARGARFAAGGALAAAALLFVWLAHGASPSADAMSDSGPIPRPIGDATSLVDGG